VQLAASGLGPEDFDTSSPSELDDSISPKVGLPYQTSLSKYRLFVELSETPVLVDHYYGTHSGWSKLSSVSPHWFACTSLA